MKKYLALIILCTLGSRTPAQSDTNSTGDSSSLASAPTLTLEDLDLELDIQAFYSLKATTLTRSNYFATLLAMKNFTNTSAQYITNMIALDIRLDKTNLGPLTLTNSSGLVFTDACIYRIDFVNAMYRTAAGGGKIKIESLDSATQKQLDFNPLMAIAQEFVTFRDDQTKKRAALTAHYNSSPPVETSVSSTSAVDTVIRARAEKEWPGNYEMQEYEIKTQTQAYNWVASNTFWPGVPMDVFKQIQTTAAQEWENDYSMQEYEIKKQAAAYVRLH